ATFDLGEDFAVTAFNPATRTAGLARGVDYKTIEAFLTSLLSPETVDPYPVLQVRIVGGTNNLTCEQKFKDIAEVIWRMNREQEFINVMSADINEKPHPESFKIMLFDGSVGSVQSKKP